MRTQPHPNPEGAIPKKVASSATAPMSVILASKTYYYMDYGPHLTFKSST
jgi:hypothetical protein